MKHTYNGVRINIEWTLSKIMAFIVLIIGSIYAFYYQDSGVLIATFSACSAIIAVKTYTSSKEKQKHIRMLMERKKLGHKHPEVERN